MLPTTLRRLIDEQVVKMVPSLDFYEEGMVDPSVEEIWERQKIKAKSAHAKPVVRRARKFAVVHNALTHPGVRYSVPVTEHSRLFVVFDGEGQGAVWKLHAGQKDEEALSALASWQSAPFAMMRFVDDQDSW